jgi:hypothetical protein
MTFHHRQHLLPSYVERFAMSCHMNKRDWRLNKFYILACVESVSSHNNQ